MTTTRTPVPAVEGLFTMDPQDPHLIGARGVTQKSYFFPKNLAGSDPGELALGDTAGLLDRELAEGADGGRALGPVQG